MKDKYKWATPYEWVKEWAPTLTKDELLVEFLKLAGSTSSDDLQDRYQTDMGNDGYFEIIEED